MILPTVAMLNELVETAIEPHYATASIGPAILLISIIITYLTPAPGEHLAFAAR